MAVDRIYDLIDKDDGVYLTISYDVPNQPRVTRGDVMALIEEYAIPDVDMVAVAEALKSETSIEVKISNVTSIVQVDESAQVEIEPDRMLANIIFSPPVNRGRMLNKADVEILLRRENVIIDMNMIEEALANKRYGRKMPIAMGRLAAAGTDGYLQFHFDRSNIKPKPKIMEDGTVNFKQLDMFKLCSRGDVLVTSVPAVDGIDGQDVYGNVLTAPKPKPPAPMPRGKGTAISPDGMHLIAEFSGQLLLADGKINVSPQLEIEANVDNSTGNIDFNGQVVVRGNVVSGFEIKAVGNIEVVGVVEAAKLTSVEGNITLVGGVQGSGKAELTAAGDITAKFIESCKVTAGGNIVSDSILKSHVRCDGSVTVAGKNGLLVGGSLVAGEKLVAQMIGSPMGTLTDIEVGGNPRELQRQKDLIAEFNSLKDEYEKCEKGVNMLSALKQKGQLDDERKAMLVKMINTKMVYRDKMTKLQNDIDTITQMLAVNAGTVSASKMIRPGVRITIGNAQMTIRDELSNCKLRNNGEKISIGPNL